MKKPEGEEPEGAGDRPPVVEAVRAGETEYPQQVANGLAVGVWGVGHLCLLYRLA
jgi:hypothetical protein